MPPPSRQKVICLVIPNLTYQSNSQVYSKDLMFVFVSLSSTLVLSFTVAIKMFNKNLHLLQSVTIIDGNNLGYTKVSVLASAPCISKRLHIYVQFTSSYITIDNISAAFLSKLTLALLITQLETTLLLCSLLRYAEIHKNVKASTI